MQGHLGAVHGTACDAALCRSAIVITANRRTGRWQFSRDGKTRACGNGMGVYRMLRERGLHHDHTAAPQRVCAVSVTGKSFSSACAAKRAARTEQEFGNVFLNEVIEKPELLPPFITLTPLVAITAGSSGSRDSAVCCNQLSVLHQTKWL